MKPVTGSDVPVVRMIAYESKEERRGTQDVKIGERKTTESYD
ncbi:MAG: hypothetical protein WKF91_10120 [Segetibacter sp.]